MEKLLSQRKEQKRKKPNFVRQDAHKKKRVARTGWRRSKGSNSKMRQGFKGYRKSPGVGYKSPALVKGLSRTGLEIVLVSNVANLSEVNAKTQGIIIGKTVGSKKKIEILEVVVKNEISVINMKDPKKMLATLKEKFDKKQSDKKTTQKVKEEKEKEKEKQALKKEKEEKKTESKSLETITDDEKKDIEDKKKADEKKEKDKLLIKQS